MFKNYFIVNKKRKISHKKQKIRNCFFDMINRDIIQYNKFNQIDVFWFNKFYGCNANRKDLLELLEEVKSINF
ncbi:hypothetical protein C4R89_00955 [Clostridioides difficile]|nr:hypothetical protein [Clostridioides difficile]MDB0438106.1 hypothetical protein [Clostridioides difficile]